MDPLTFIITIIVICLLLLIGLYISEKMQEAGMLFLILVGIIASKTVLRVQGFIEIPYTALAYLSIFGMIILSFHVFSQINRKDLDSTFARELDFFLIYGLLTISVMTFILVFFFGIENILHAVIFSALCLGAEVILKEKSKKKDARIKHMLFYEYAISGMFVLIIPLALAIISTNAETRLFAWSLFSSSYPAVIQMIIGMASGVFMGIILLNILLRKFSWAIKSITLFFGLFCAYFMSEYIGGIGIFATAMLGIFIAQIKIPDKKKFLKQSFTLARPVEGLIIIALGYVAGNTLSPDMLMKGLILFAALFFIRVISFFAAFSFRDLSWKEKLMVSTRFPKEGILATLLLSFFILGLSGVSFFIPLITSIMIYSLAVSLIGRTAELDRK